MGINLLTSPTPSTDSNNITSELQQIFEQIVQDITFRLGCVGAIASTIEQSNMLCVRAAAFDVPPQILHPYLNDEGLSFINPNAVILLGKEKKNINNTFARENQSSPPYAISNNLHDVLRPLVNKRLSNKIQKAFEINQLITVPFMLRGEIVGTLTAAKKSDFNQKDIDFLLAFANQTAATIRSQRRLGSMAVLERIILSMQATMLDETKVLQTIVDTVVYELGYIGAMVATLEAGDALPVRAYALDAMPKLLVNLEAKAGLSLVGPKSIVYLNDLKFKDNLSVRAVRGLNGRPQKYITSGQLYDLLRPFADKNLAMLAQRMLKIKQVIAVPFFLQNEVVGNLFVASKNEQFSDWEVSILTAFGQQAAAGLRNARLYRETEKQREIAQIFGRMAFSATAAVHALGNHLSSVHTYLQMLTTLDEFPPEHQAGLIKNSSAILERLEKASRLLDHLHEPWQQTADRPINVNDCLNIAVREVFPQILQEMQKESFTLEDGLKVNVDLAYDLAPVSTSNDMLTEAFRVLIKNAKEAVQSCTRREITIRSQAQDCQIVIQIQDTGRGIKPENLQNIFEIGWSTKGELGMGFGLFWTRDFFKGLGGSISVDSQIDKGTCFTLTLPTAVSQTSAESSLLETGTLP